MGEMILALQIATTMIDTTAVMIAALIAGTTTDAIAMIIIDIRIATIVIASKTGIDAIMIKIEAGNVIMTKIKAKLRLIEECVLYIF